MNKINITTRNLSATLIVSFFLLLFPMTNKAQIEAGNDTSICSPGCATLNATVTNINGATTYTESSITYAPDPFTGGTSCNIVADDGYSAALPIGFTFCFYGNSYTQFLGSSNGVLSFDVSQANGYCQWPIGAAIPSSSDPMDCVMGLWQDMYPPDGGTIKYAVYGVAPFRRMVYSYDAEPYFSCWTSTLYTGEVILYETTNVIEIHVQSKPDCGGWNGGYGIEGIQNATGTLASFVPNRNYPTVYTLTNDAVRFTPSGVQAYTVNWYTVVGNTLVGTGNTISVCPTTTTSYYAQVIYNCSNATFTDTVTVNVSNPTATTTVISNSSCVNQNSGSAYVTATGNGPFTYNWNTVPVQTTDTAINLTAGTYMVTVTTPSGCTVVDSVTISGPTPTTAAIASQVNVSCNGGNNGSAIVTAGGQGPFTYSWSTIPLQTTDTANGLTFGTYTVTVTASNGCTDTAMVTITQPTPTTVSITAQTNASCNGGANGTATATGAGGTPNYTYLWSNAQNTQTATGLANGTYTVTVSDANGCTGTTTVTITQPALLTSTVTNIVNVPCNQNIGSATVNGFGGTPGYTYSWSNGQNTQSASGLAAGTYTATVTDANGCTSTSLAVIGQLPSMTVTISGNANICIGESATLSVTVSGGVSPYTYDWNPGGPGGNSLTQTPNSTTTYVVTITDANGCITLSAPMTITVSTPPTVLFSGTNLAGCAPLTVNFIDESTTTTGTIASWMWDFGDGNSSTLQNPTNIYSAGIYNVTLTATNSFGCSATDTINNYVDVSADPKADFLANPWRTTIITPEISFIDKSTNATQWYWNFGDHHNFSGTSTLENPYYTYSEPGIYTVSLWVTNGHGCNDSISKNIIIDPDFEFFIPNSFSPDGDGLNDVFTGYGDNVYLYEMKIFNRWGENIFTTSDLNNGWNGKINGNGADVVQDTYVYSIFITDGYGNQHHYQGKVALIR